MLFNSRINLVVRWAVGLLCAFLIAGVSVGRIYFGTHWASDILPAYIVGFVMLAVVVLQYLRRKPC
jgi:membrane-associated phospholipid phosphatase